jgi:NTE family protein
MLDEPDELRTIFVVDLYPRDGARPNNFETAMARKSDLIFGNQTYLRLEAYRRELLLRQEIARLKHEVPAASTKMVLLSYHPTPEEAGSERAFDLSFDSAQRRWMSGQADMERALALVTTTAEKEPLIAVQARGECRELTS